jgi:hypothetical protein
MCLEVHGRAYTGNMFTTSAPIHLGMLLWFYDRQHLGMFHYGSACKQALFRETHSPPELKALLDDKVRPS